MGSGRAAKHAALPAQASYHLIPGADPRKSLRSLRDAVDGDQTVVGLGLSLVSLLECGIDELRVFPEFSGFGLDVPSTPAALWLWLRGTDLGELYNRHRALDALLGSAFRADRVLDAFIHGSGRDLTGYEELEHAPESAHVKRTAQESFDPEAFVVRRSMPWAEGRDCGLLFTAFGCSFDAFEAQFRRMLGVEDGTMDALFTFTRPLTGAYFWCPPVKGKKLDLSLLGL